MQRISIIILILILGLAYAIQNEGVKQIIHPKFNTADFSIPKSMNFQGMLYEAGEPVDTTMNMWFGIYDLSSGGSLLFEQAINNVVVANGWFTVTLVNIPNSVFPISGPTRYLEVKAPATGPALEPRVPLLSVGYSYHSLTSDSAKYLILPCTLQAAIAYPEAVLNIGNDEDGIGIKIDEASYGISIDSARSFGVYIRKSAGDGVYVRNADRDGVFVNNVKENGVYVHSADNDGIYVRRADSSGVYVDAARYGMRVDSVGMNGIWISKVGGNGFRVDDASVSGVLVSHVDNDGFRVDDAGWRGFYVSQAGYDGLYVSRSGYDGVYIYRAGDDGVSVDSAANCGFCVNRADTGVMVGQSNIGLAVPAALYYGLKVDGAGWYGVYARSGEQGGHFRNTTNLFYALTAYNETGSSVNYRGLYVHGNTYSTGGYSQLLGNDKVGFSLASPDLEIVTSGSGSLSGGTSRISFEKSIQDAFSTDIPLKVIVTPTSRCNGLCVIEKSDTGFTVEEVMSGKSNATFDWIAIGRIKGYEKRPDIKPVNDELNMKREVKR